MPHGPKQWVLAWFTSVQPAVAHLRSSIGCVHYQLITQLQPLPWDDSFLTLGRYVMWVIVIRRDSTRDKQVPNPARYMKQGAYVARRAEKGLITIYARQQQLRNWSERTDSTMPPPPRRRHILTNVPWLPDIGVARDTPSKEIRQGAVFQTLPQNGSASYFFCTPPLNNLDHTLLCSGSPLSMISVSICLSVSPSEGQFLFGQYLIGEPILLWTRVLVSSSEGEGDIKSNMYVQK